LRWPAETADLAGMDANPAELIVRQAGERSLHDDLCATADAVGGSLHAESDPAAAVTPLGQWPFFVDDLTQDGGGSMPASPIAPLGVHRPNAPRNRELLLSTRSGHPEPDFCRLLNSLAQSPARSADGRTGLARKIRSSDPRVW
jgi:hypothetical protein